MERKRNISDFEAEERLASKRSKTRLHGIGTIIVGLLMFMPTFLWLDSNPALALLIIPGLVALLFGFMAYINPDLF